MTAAVSADRNRNRSVQSVARRRRGRRTRDAAWLWDRGYTAAEASDALAAADGGGRDRALEALFRETLVRATDGRDWSAWPSTGGGGGERGGGGGGGGDDDDDGGDDPWEDELVAVEAIFGDDVVSRPSRDVVIVTVDVDDGRGGKGKVALEVRRPSGGGYPTEEPPTISLAAASGDGATSRGALRAATASLAAAAAAAAEDGIPCVHSLAELLPGALAERADAPAPGEGAGEEEEEEEEETDAVKEEKEEIVVGAAKASSSSIPAPARGRRRRRRAAARVLDAHEVGTQSRHPGDRPRSKPPPRPRRRVVPVGGGGGERASESRAGVLLQRRRRERRSVQDGRHQGEPPGVGVARRGGPRGRRLPRRRLIRRDGLREIHASAAVHLGERDR